MKVRSVLAGCLVTALAVGSCSGGGEGDAEIGNDPETMSIATSAPLEQLVNDLVEAFEASESPETPIEVTLHEQGPLASLVGGSDPPDVVIGPDGWIVAEVDDLVPLGRNLAVIAVPVGNPAGVADLTAFNADSGLATRACGPDSQFGNLIGVVLNNNAIDVGDDVLGVDCDQEALDQLAAGDLDAVLVFRDGAAARDDVEAVDIPDTANLVILVSSFVFGTDVDSAAFEEFLASAEAKEVITAGGYLP